MSEKGLSMRSGKAWPKQAANRRILRLCEKEMSGAEHKEPAAHPPRNNAGPHNAGFSSPPSVRKEDFLARSERIRQVRDLKAPRTDVHQLALNGYGFWFADGEFNLTRSRAARLFAALDARPLRSTFKREHNRTHSSPHKPLVCA